MCDMVLCYDTIASFCRQSSGRIFAHFHAVAVKRSSSMQNLVSWTDHSLLEITWICPRTKEDGVRTQTGPLQCVNFNHWATHSPETHKTKLKIEVEFWEIRGKNMKHVPNTSEHLQVLLHNITCPNNNPVLSKPSVMCYMADIMQIISILVLSGIVPQTVSCMRSHR